MLLGVNPKYPIIHVASQHKYATFLMHLVAIGWIYVALMMAVAEATSTTETVLGAFFTFVLYGVAPVSLVLYLLGTPGRKRAIRAREAAELAKRAAAASAAPDTGGEAPADTVSPVRKES